MSESLYVDLRKYSVPAVCSATVFFASFKAASSASRFACQSEYRCQANSPPAMMITTAAVSSTNRCHPFIAPPFRHKPRACSGYNSFDAPTIGRNRQALFRVNHGLLSESRPETAPPQAAMKMQPCARTAFSSCGQMPNSHQFRHNGLETRLYDRP